MNNKLILCGLGAMLSLVSCQERFSDKTDDGSTTTVRAGIVQNVSKTWLDLESAQTPVPVYWSDGDQINVNGQNSSSLEVPEGQKVSSAEFLMRSVAVPYNAIYPASIVTGTLYDAEGYIDVTIPSTQRYEAKTFASGSAILYGYSASAEESVSMHNACSAIMVELKGTAADEIISASVTSNSSLFPISGKFKLRPQDGELIAVEGKSELSLSDVDVVLSPEVSRFFFTVPAGLYEDGFSLTFKRKSDRRAMQCKWTPSDTLRAGHLYRFADVTFVPGAKSIENAGDWNEFATALNEGGDVSKYLFKDGVVRISEDIEAETLTKINLFKLAIDAQGHSITRTAAAAPLFGAVEGEVRNFVTAGALAPDILTAPLADTLCVGGIITDCVNNMDISMESANEMFCGGLVNIMTGGTLKNCVNNGDILLTADCTSAKVIAQIGGLVARTEAAEDVTLDNCVNNGSLTITPIVTSSSYGLWLASVAGIVAWNKSNAAKLSVKNCTNNAALTISADKNTIAGVAAAITIGGIVGINTPINTDEGLYNTPKPANGMKGEISGCTNNGSILNCGINAASISYLHAKVYSGGICGAVLGQSAEYFKISNCKSYASISTYNVGDGSDKAAYCGIAGGIAGWGGYVEISDCEVNAQIGTVARQSVSVCGGIASAMRPFTVSNTKIFARIQCCICSRWSGDRAIVANCIKQNGSNNNTPAPDVNGSRISNCYLGGTFYGAATVLPTESDTSDWSNNPNLMNSSMFDSKNYSKNLVCGHNYKTVATDVTVESCSYWSGK